MNFKEKTKPQDPEKKTGKKKHVLKSFYNFFEDREKVLHAFDSKIFPIKTKGSGYLESKSSNLKILTPKQKLQRLPTALVYSLYQSKEITKKVYNNILKSIKV